MTDQPKPVPDAMREALADILALAEHADKYRPQHFADKVIAKCTSALSAPVPPADGAIEAAAKYLDDLEAGLLPGNADTPSQVAEKLRFASSPGTGAVEREPTPDMRIAGGVAWAEASKTAETFVDCADACWKAMWDAR